MKNAFSVHLGSDWSETDSKKRDDSAQHLREPKTHLVVFAVSGHQESTRPPPIWLIFLSPLDGPSRLDEGADPGRAQAFSRRDQSYTPPKFRLNETISNQDGRECYRNTDCSSHLLHPHPRMDGTCGSAVMRTERGPGTVQVLDGKENGVAPPPLGASLGGHPSCVGGERLCRSCWLGWRGPPPRLGVRSSQDVQHRAWV